MEAKPSIANNSACPNLLHPRSGIAPDSRLESAFRALCDVVAKLRSPEGCPWDREQTLESIKPYTLEETYELLEAIDSGQDDAIVEELGDVLLQVVLDAQIGADEGRFNLIDVIDRLREKMVHRHPHVFSDAVADSLDDVRAHWRTAKSMEKKQRASLLDGIPVALPELARAAKIASRAARVGYDFPNRNMLFDKLAEELDELAIELFDDGMLPNVKASVDVPVVKDDHLTGQTRVRAENELGDVFVRHCEYCTTLGPGSRRSTPQIQQKICNAFSGHRRRRARTGQITGRRLPPGNGRGTISLLRTSKKSGARFQRDTDDFRF